MVRQTKGNKNLMSKAIIIEKYGNKNLKLVKIKVPEPKANQVLIEQEAAGVNFVDLYHRDGTYKLQNLPAILGLEGAGTIIKTGDQVSLFKIGDRVSYTTGPVGSYREHRVMDENNLIKLPDYIPTKIAAAITTKGLTAQTLCRRTYIVVPGVNVFVTAAAGGVGLILAQWVKALGANIIVGVGSQKKADFLRSLGFQHLIVYTEDSIKDKISYYTNNFLVSVAFDSVGRDYIKDIIESIHMFGSIVNYGHSSGAVPPINILDLSKKSLSVTRPNLWHYKRHRPELLESAHELFKLYRDGKIKLNINEYKPDQAWKAHKDIAKRKNIGSSIILF